MDNHPRPLRGLREPRVRGDLIVPTGNQERTILDNFIRAAEDGTGVTDNEGIEATNFNPSSYRSRRMELERGGWVRNSGYARREGNAKMRRSIVWVLSPRGAEQAGFDGYRAMRSSRSDKSLFKPSNKNAGRRRGYAAPQQPDVAPHISPEEMQTIRKRNFFQECRVLIERSVQNFTTDKAPDPEEFGAFLGNDGIGSPGFSQWELQRAARYLLKVAGAFDRNRNKARDHHPYHHREES